jgi:hypothetical protein
MSRQTPLLSRRSITPLPTKSICLSSGSAILQGGRSGARLMANTDPPEHSSGWHVRRGPRRKVVTKEEGTLVPSRDAPVVSIDCRGIIIVKEDARLRYEVRKIVAEPEASLGTGRLAPCIPCVVGITLASRVQAVDGKETGSVKANRTTYSTFAT